MSPFPVLLLASSILAAWLLFLVWLLPQRILGREGLWMLGHVQDYVPDGWGRSVQRPVAEGSSLTHEEAESLRAGVSTATE